jgi:hypothetical protein
VLAHFKGSLTKALIVLFPEIGLDKSKFMSLPSITTFFSPYLYLRFVDGYWKDIENRRQLLSAFACSKDKDPLSPKTWYNVDFNTFLSYKVTFIHMLGISITNLSEGGSFYVKLL